MTDCPCCFEPIEASVAALACSHRFHITCLVNWFLTQANNELPQNCPCCRAEAGEKERLPEEPEGAEHEDDESEEYEESEEILLTRAELDDLLKNTLGGIGVRDGMWFSFFEDDDPERLLAEHKLPFVCGEINDYARAQGGRYISMEEWESLVERFGEDEEDAEAPVDRTHLSLSRHQLEDIVWEAGGVGVSPEQWAAGAEGEETAFFERSDIDAYLAREDQTGRPLTDEHWNRILETHPHFVVPAGEVRPSVAAWRRQPDGSWVRVALNPDVDEPAVWGEGSAEPPPDDLTRQTTAAARRLQALWRGYKTREHYEAARALSRMRAHN